MNHGTKLVAVLLVFVLAQLAWPVDPPAVAVGQTAPAFTMPEYNPQTQQVEDTVKLSDHLGKVVVLIFGSYC